MDRCDVLVVGGGPAGSSCAWKLNRAGADVIVVDRQQFPRDKVCAGWVTPVVFDELEIATNEYQRSHTLQPITRFLTGVIYENSLETNYGREVSYAVRRCEFDDYLLRRSAASLRFNTECRSLRREGPTWIFNDAIRADIVVGAGGHFCPVARQFMPQKTDDHSHRKSDVVLAQETELEMNERQQACCCVSPDRPELFFYPDLKGYAWVVRKGTFLNIGVGRENEPHLSAYVERFIEWLTRTQKIPQDMEYRLRGHAYRLQRNSPQCPSIEGLLLVGDSLGLAVPESGEGIRPAVESGLLAAASILESKAKSNDALTQVYQAKINARFARRSFAPLVFSDSAIRRFVVRQLLHSHLFVRSVLLDRWFLSAHQPSLIV